MPEGVKITNFSFCDHNNKHNLQINVLNSLETTNGKFSFSVLFSVIDFSPMVNHDIKLIFSDMDGEILIETDNISLEGTGQKGDSNEKGVITGATMAVDFLDVLFQGQGVYVMKIYFDEELINEFHIPVVYKERSEL
ncbi:hypothetical protein ABFV99_25665 [Cytobacillus horneckiae]|uniref:hypothetical protein n=1 Tax=Cytobacillus horneckiae TaxID=549687 RepID=UPI0034CE8FED